MSKNIFGWAGKYLRVNLSTGKISTESTEPYLEFLGGRGICQSILLNEVEAKTQPLDPENKLIIAAGPLTGTMAPCSTSFIVGNKNVQTGGMATSFAGGHFGPELKFAGFDLVVVEGKAERPVYLAILDGKAEIRDAGHLWGRTIWDTDAAIKEELGDRDVRVAAIGPAGENLVKFACIIVDRARAAAYGGCGAVMGSKNLKAFAVRGTRPIAVADPQGFMELVDQAWAKIESNPSVEGLRVRGTQGQYGVGGTDGTKPVVVRYYQDEYQDPEVNFKLSEAVFRDKYEVRRMACFNCPIYCSHYYSIPSGPYGGLKAEGLEANSVNLFGPNLGVTDPEVVLMASAFCNQMGMNLDQAAASIGWAFQCYEDGLITEEDADGMSLRWGDGATVIKLLEKISRRESFGDLLAEGPHLASRYIGRGSEKYVAQVKGLPTLESRMRIFKAWGLGVAVSTRGGTHLNGSTTTEGQRVSPEVGEKLFGVPTAGDFRIYEGKGKLTGWFEFYKCAVDSLGVCYFTSYWENVGLLGPDEYAALFSKATGVPLSGEELMRAGRRIHNIEKAFNTLHTGFGRRDDYLSERFYKEPIKSGPFAGVVLDAAKWDEMLDEYYDYQGWDRATGWQKAETLEELGLSRVREKLQAAGRLA